MQKIKFMATSEDIELTVPPPKPAKLFIPDWYKEKKNFDGGIPVIKNGIAANLTVKACQPFFDAMTSGYIQETWADVWIEGDSNLNVEYNYSRSPKLMSSRGEPSIPIPKEYYPYEFLWHQPYIPITPKGYSLMFFQPQNRTDLPFMIPSGIMDSDVFHHERSGNVPFYIRKDFNGLIPAGTPMFHIVPIKRDSWKSEVLSYDEDWFKKGEAIRFTNFWGVYRKLFHQKKKFE